MRKTLIVFLAFSLVEAGSAHGQKTAKSEIKITKLSNGEIWARIHVHPTIAVRLLPDMPATGQFRTAIVRNLPPSDIVGAPQSVEIQILGDCQTKTVQIWGMLPYSGKMRAGYPEGELATGPEGVTRRVEPNSPMERIFKIVCKQ